MKTTTQTTTKWLTSKTFSGLSADEIDWIERNGLSVQPCENSDGYVVKRTNPPRQFRKLYAHVCHRAASVCAVYASGQFTKLWENSTPANAIDDVIRMA